MKLFKQMDVLDLLRQPCKVKFRNYGVDEITNYHYTNKQEAIEIVFHVPTISKNDFASLNLKGLSEDEVKNVFIRIVQSLGDDDTFDLFTIHSAEPGLLLESAYQFLADHFEELFLLTNKDLYADMVCYATEGVVRSDERIKRAESVLSRAKEWLIKNA